LPKRRGERKKSPYKNKFWLSWRKTTPASGQDTKGRDEDGISPKKKLTIVFEKKKGG